MANNYFDATGVLILERVTPVIAALFGAFSLDASYPGNGEAYIATLAESNEPSWDDVLERLIDLAYELRQPLSAGCEVSIQDCLRVLAKHFQSDNREDLEHLINHHSFEDCADLQALFLIATCFDDGHGLKAIKFEGAWHCSKPRLFEFSGEGVFISREVALYGHSSRTVNLGEELRTALLNGNLDEAADKLAEDAITVLSGINDEATRRQLRAKLASKLVESPSRGGAASGCL